MSDSSSPGSPPAQQPTSDTPSQLDRWGGDPCAVFRQLTEKRRDLVSGTGIAEFEYEGNGTKRRTKYNLANLNLLDQEIREAQAACAALLNCPNPGRRFALTGGYRHDNRLGCGPAARWSARTGYY